MPHFLSLGMLLIVVHSNATKLKPRNMDLLLPPDSLVSVSEHILELPHLCSELENILVKL